MVSYISQKKALKKQILVAVDTAGPLDKERLIAELCLNTGFTERTIKKMLSQLAELDYIKMDGLVVTRPDKPKPPEVLNETFMGNDTGEIQEKRS